MPLVITGSLVWSAALVFNSKEQAGASGAVRPSLTAQGQGQFLTMETWTRSLNSAQNK